MVSRFCDQLPYYITIFTGKDMISVKIIVNHPGDINLGPPDHPAPEPWNRTVVRVETFGNFDDDVSDSNAERPEENPSSIGPSFGLKRST